MAVKGFMNMNMNKVKKGFMNMNMSFQDGRRGVYEYEYE